MGQLCFYRIPAIGTAAVAALAIAFLIGSATTCTYLVVYPRDSYFLDFREGPYKVHMASTTLGVFCESPYYESEGDKMWELSRIFLMISLSVGSLCTALAVGLSTVIAPTNNNWKLLSALAAITACAEVPIFLMFETVACSEESCKLEKGCFFVIISIIGFVTVTLLTQSLDVPRWGDELNAWRVKNGAQHSIMCLADENLGLNGNDEGTRLTRPKRQAKNSLVRWMERRRWAGEGTCGSSENSRSLDDEDLEDRVAHTMEVTKSSYANSTNSRLLLKIQNGKRPGDDQKSVTTFGELDVNDFVDAPMLCKSFTTTEHEAEPELIDLEAQSANADKKEFLFIVGPATGEGSDGRKTPPIYYSDPRMFENQPEVLKRTFEKESLLADGEDVSPQTKPKDKRDVVFIVPPDSNTNPPLYYTDPAIFENQPEVLQRSFDQEAKEGLLVHEAPKSDCVGLATGIRALTSRLQNDSKRRKKGYQSLGDCDSVSSPPISPPRPCLTDAATSPEQEYEPPDSDIKFVNKQLMHDWEALHKAASAGILLPNITITSSGEDEPHRVTYSDDDSYGSSSVRSFGNKPDDQEYESCSDLSDTDHERSTSVDDDEPDQQKQESKPDQQKQESKKRHSRRRRRAKFSSTNSIASHSSLLETTIAEETDAEIKEFESSDDESQTGSPKSVRSLPAMMGSTLDRDYSLVHSKTYPSRFAPDTRSLCSDASTNSDIMHMASISRIAPIGGPPSTIPVPTMAVNDAQGYRPEDDFDLSNPRYSRGKPTGLAQLTCSTKKDVRAMSLAKFSDRGIHAPAVAVVSDESSDGENRSISSGGAGGASSIRSSKSAYSQARQARIRRLNYDVSKRRRSKTADSPRTARRKPIPKFNIQVLNLDPSLVKDMQSRHSRREYGPDEASL
eukprot:CAMPEP_0194035796 /NCGR_PEP_ID=MMETSP0009_2-20130614/8218_1 /TAXON_ID=210454 /ORGANISM="Grammatophora oceanica, Strain CCMP 410" /LENGTH=903 /DNA_ID=CAMNT_0038677307 /DNA_START=203 /DNA_END=2914 /DNA_ORIENTATION=+